MRGGGGEEGEGEVEEAFGCVVGDEEAGEGWVGGELVGVLGFGGGGGGGRVRVVLVGGGGRRFEGTEIGVTIVLEA